MKRAILIYIFLISLIPVRGQISIIADSMVISKLNDSKDKFISISRQSESLSLEIDKDLLTLRIFGKDHEHAVIEKAYLIELLDVDDNKEKWEFQGEDRNCIAYTITLDVNRKRINLITSGKEPVIGKPLTMISYPIVDIKINKEAIDKHLKEKENTKY